MAHVPLGPGGDDNLPFDGRLAAAATGAEQFVEVEMAVEPQFALWHNFALIVRVAQAAAGLEALQPLVFRLWVECDTFQSGGAMVTGEAFRMEPCFERGRGRPRP